MTMLDAPTFRFSRSLYDQMVERGLLEDQHVELIEGEILQMSPIYRPHVTACALVAELLRKVFESQGHVLVQSPLGVGDSEPQPDIAVVPGSPRDYENHPDSALLVVEISDTSLRFDRKTKASLYASAGIPEYWILNLRDRQLEVFREPKRDRSERFGYRYAKTLIVKRRESVVPVSAPKAMPLKVADMLP